jgi:hypothetical protein
MNIRENNIKIVRNNIKIIRNNNFNMSNVNSINNSSKLGISIFPDQIDPSFYQNNQGTLSIFDPNKFSCFGPLKFLDPNNPECNN